jgi:hypothetical protein
MTWCKCEYRVTYFAFVDFGTGWRNCSLSKCACLFVLKYECALDMALRCRALVCSRWLERLSWLVSDRQKSSDVREDEMKLAIKGLNLLPLEVVTDGDVAAGTGDGVIAGVQLIAESVTSRENDALVGVEPDQSLAF